MEPRAGNKATRIVVLVLVLAATASLTGGALLVLERLGLLTLRRVPELSCYWFKERNDTFSLAIVKRRAQDHFCASPVIVRRGRRYLVPGSHPPVRARCDVAVLTNAGGLILVEKPGTKVLGRMAADERREFLTRVLGDPSSATWLESRECLVIHDETAFDGGFEIDTAHAALGVTDVTLEVYSHDADSRWAYAWDPPKMTLLICDSDMTVIDEREPRR
ncbi:hypothetical protein HY251_11600 [bacterium]|nr:hypothetical protein [bacterium]